MPFPALRFPLVTASAVVVLSLAAACSSEDAGNGATSVPGPTTNPSTADGGETDGAVSPQPTDIEFGDGAKFAARACTVTLKYSGAAGAVKIAGEFTNWESGAIAMTKNGSTFEATLSPSASVEAGKLYAYKLIVDG